QIEVVTKGENVGCDFAEILSNQRQISQLGLQMNEQVRSRPGYPSTLLGRLLAERHLPGGAEAAKVIESNDIDQLERRLHPVHPPGVAGLSHRLPVVVRVPPELTGLGKVIGGNARNNLGPQ